MKHQSTTGAKGDLVNILLDILKAFLILFIYRELSKLYFEKVPFLLCYQRRSCERVWELRPLMIFIDNIQHSFSSVAINKAQILEVNRAMKSQLWYHKLTQSRLSNSKFTIYIYLHTTDLALVGHVESAFQMQHFIFPFFRNVAPRRRRATNWNVIVQLRINYTFVNCPEPKIAWPNGGARKVDIA